MIEAIESKGANKANAICDDCGKVETVTADYERIRAGKWEPNERQVLTKVLQNGWSHIKGKLRCPRCEADRRAAVAPKPADPKPAASNFTDLRRPTAVQKRQIIALLEDVYDDKAKRYRGGETDKSVADAVGGGCMFGWVAEIRSELFGPDGGNEEMDTLLADLAKWQKEADALAEAMHEHLRGFNDVRRSITEALAKIEAIRRAVGPKAAVLK